MAKSHLDIKAALLEVTDLTSSIKALETELNNNRGVPDESLWKKVSSFSLVTSSLAQEPQPESGLTSEQSDVISALKDAGSSIVTHKKLDETMPGFVDFLNRQWLDPSAELDEKAKVTPQLKLVEQPEDFDKLLADTVIAGLAWLLSCVNL